VSSAAAASPVTDDKHIVTKGKPTIFSSENKRSADGIIVDSF